MERKPYNYINDAHLLSGLNKEWEKVLHLGVKKKVPKGVIFNCHQCETFGYVQKGQLRLSSVSDDGRERIVFYLGEGCICMEIPLFSNFLDKYTPEFVTTTDCVIYFFPSDLMTDTDFIKKYPELMINIVHSMAVKSSAFFSQLSEEAVLGSTAQFCRFLYREYEKNQETTFHFGFSQIELSLMLSLHRNTLCRIVRELRNENILGKCTKNCIEILDLEKLKKIAQI